MGNLLNIGFWFSMRPDSMTTFSLKTLAVILVIFFICAVIFAFKKNRKRSLYNKMLQKMSVFCNTNFIIGLFLFLFSYELLPFLSMRFWFLLWGLSMAVWFGFIVAVFKEIPKIREKMMQEAEFKKYIP